MRFEKQFVVLFKKAKADCETAKIIFAEIEKGNAKLEIWIVFFHLQQSVEKALKALLAYHKVHILKTHDIGSLLMKLEEIGVNAVFDKESLSFLSYFAVEGRYGAVLDKVENPERFLFLVENLLNFIEKELK